MTSAVGDAVPGRPAPAPERPTLAEAEGFLAAYRAGLARGEVAVDLSGLTAFDSAGVGALVAAARAAAACTPPLAARFANPPAQLRSLADLYGVAELIFGAA